VPALGVLYRPERLPEDLPQAARAAEAAGFDELWVVEDCFLAGGLTMAASALAATGRLGVGVGLLPAAVRNPAIVAMEIAALARLHPGRLRVAFGHGVESWMRQIGARPPDRLVALEETVTAVRALLAGESLTVDGGHVRLDGVQLDQPPPQPPPILIGTTGPRALAIAGRASDGVLLPEGSGPAAVRWARELSGARMLATYAWMHVDDDGASARAALRPLAERWAAGGGYPRLAVHAGLGADGSGLLDDRVLRELAVAGDAADCARAIAALAAAGADTVILDPLPPAYDEQFARFAAEVMPLL
jgi:alkanesulfonate monooxygenase SsuD/methylene tetrahydromethanopterin reductase-like flavin-dependent oxidoreductase (luciferase family)